MAENTISITVKADDRTGPGFASVDRGLSGLGNLVKNFALGATAGFVAVGVGAFAMGKSFIDAAEESQKVGRQTEAVIASMGGAAGVTADEVGKLAGKLSLATGVDDELIQSGQNMLLTFGNIRNGVEENQKIFDRATQATLDMSVAMGQDMTQSAVQVGKALNDPIAGLSALSRVGIQFTDDQKALIEGMVEAGDVMGAQGVILGELERQFGGSAEAQATASDKLKTAFGNLQESIGAMLLPAFEDIVGWITETGLPKFEELAAKVSDRLKPAIADLKVWFSDNLLPAMQDIWSFIETDLLPIWTDMADKVKEDLVPQLQDLAEKLGDLLPFLGDTGEGSEDTSRKFDGLKRAAELVSQALSFMLDVNAAMIDILNRVVGAIVWLQRGTWGVLNWIWDVAVAAFNGLSDAANAAYRAIERVRDAFDRLPRGGAGSGGGIGSLVGAVVNPVGTLLSGRPFASGGIVGAQSGGLRSGWHLFGEHGPELGRVPSGTMIHSAGDTRGRLGGGGPVQVVVHVDLSGGDDHLLEWFRNRIRVEGGGDVQLALGWSR